MAYNMPSVMPPGFEETLARAKRAQTGPTLEETLAKAAAAEQQKAWLDPSSPQYKGPAWYQRTNPDGSTDVVMSDDPGMVQRQNDYLGQGVPPAGSGVDVNAAISAATNTGVTPTSAPKAVQGPIGTIQSAPLVNANAGRRASSSNPSAASQRVAGIDMQGVNLDSVVTPPAGAGSDYDKVHDILGGINTYQNQIANLARDNTGLSVAEAQLKKATELANMQAGIATEASQRGALGQARAARNRGDRALLERQAIGEAGYIGQEAARTDALRRATAEGDLAILRATEADADRRFKLDALKEASALGLNTAALELDVTKTDLDAATRRMQLELGYAELDQQKAQMILGFTRDMAAIEFQYDQLSVEDQNEADRLLMQKYGIDEGTMLGLKQIKAGKDINWGQVLTSFVGGVGSGATAAIAKSDERAKTNIEPVESTAREFEDFMGALSANTYEYKEPAKDGRGLRFGFMAQDLEKTKLGRHMVKPDPEGMKTVEIAPLALATASGLALVYERLKDLEKAVQS